MRKLDRNARSPRKSVPLGWVTLLLGVSLVPQVAGCGGVIWGNLAVLLVTFGIFFGTLSLGRRIPPTAAGESYSDADYERG